MNENRLPTMAALFDTNRNRRTLCTQRAVIIILLGGLALGAVAAIAVPRKPHRIPFTRALESQIANGMSEGEVERLLRLPAEYPKNDWVGDGRYRFLAMRGTNPAGDRLRIWMGEEGAIVVAFDQKDRVIDVQWMPQNSSGFFERMQNVLGP